MPMTRTLLDPGPSVAGANDNAQETTPAPPSRPAAQGRGGVGRKYERAGREVKNGVLYEGRHCAPESESRGCITEKRSVSPLGHGMVFATLLGVQIVRLRFHHARPSVVLSDGAEGVRSLAAGLPIPVRRILDLVHVKHRIWEVANAVFGERTPECTAWAHTQNDHIEQGRGLAVIDAVRRLRPRAAATQALADTLATYLTHHLDRMDDPFYRSLGLRVTTAAVESANYPMTGVRLKGQGMRWVERGAAPMATLRTDLCNGEWARRTRQILDAAA